MTETKKCKRCGTERPKEKKRCQECHNIYMREVWYPRNRKKHQASVDAWRKKNPHKRIAYQNGVCEKEVKKALDESDGKCPCCLRREKLVMDHCHTTGKVRGMICNSCNTALGRAKDNIEVLERMIEYLRKKG